MISSQILGRITLIILKKCVFLIRQIFVRSHVCGVTTVESWVQEAGVRPRVMGESSSVCLWRITVNTLARQHLTCFNVLMMEFYFFFVIGVDLHIFTGPAEGRPKTQGNKPDLHCST